MQPNQKDHRGKDSLDYLIDKLLDNSVSIVSVTPITDAPPSSIKEEVATNYYHGSHIRYHIQNNKDSKSIKVLRELYLDSQSLHFGKRFNMLNSRFKGILESDVIIGKKAVLIRFEPENEIESYIINNSNLPSNIEEKDSEMLRSYTNLVYPVTVPKMLEAYKEIKLIALNLEEAPKMKKSLDRLLIK